MYINNNLREITILRREEHQRRYRLLFSKKKYQQQQIEENLNESMTVEEPCVAFLPYPNSHLLFLLKISFFSSLCFPLILRIRCCLQRWKRTKIIFYVLPGIHFFALNGLCVVVQYIVHRQNTMPCGVHEKSNYMQWVINSSMHRNKVIY